MARFLARSRAAWIGVSIVAVLLAFVTVGIGLALIGADPIGAFDQMAAAAIGSPFAISTMLVKTLPRLLAALGIAIALRAGLWNIGAEGQLYIGAAATAGLALYGPQLGFPLLLIVALGGGILAGAAWAFIPGFLRAQRGISEVITSLMLVYIAIGIVNYLVEGPWLVPGGTFPASAIVPADAKLPIVVPQTLANAGILIGIGAILVAWVLMDRSTFGLRLRAVGGNERAAEASGVPVRRTIILALVVSGAFAGLAGAVEVLGTRGRLIEGFSPGYGFEAIAIALLGGLNPFGIAAAALLFGALDAGGAGLQASGSGVPSAVVQLTAALAVIYVLIALGLLTSRERRRQAREALERAHAADEARRSQAPRVDERFLALLLAAAVGLSAPLLFAALGELISERAGVINIGLEAMMLTGAFAGVLGAQMVGDPWLGFPVAALGGAIIAAIHGVLCFRFGANQIVSGVVLNILALGATTFLLSALLSTASARAVPDIESLTVPVLSEIPVVGPALFDQNPMVYLAFLMVGILWWALRRTSAGLAISAAGERPDAAASLGVNVRLVRWLALLACGVMAGIGGGLLALAGLGIFTQNMTAGRGFIALAAVVFGRWQPIGTAVAVLLFAIADAFQIRAQALGIGIPYQFLVILPYVVTLLALALFQRRMRPPSALGIDYRPE